MRNLLNKRILLNTFMVLLLLLQGGISLGAYWQIEKLLNANNRVLHTQEVIYNISELWNKILEMQNNLRGYVLTGQTTHLADYHKETKEVFSRADHLKSLVRDNSNQVNRLHALTDLLDQRVEFFNQTIVTYQEKGKIAAEKILASDKGVYFSKQVRILAASMHNEEFILLDIRNQALNDSSALTVRILWLLGITSLLFIVLFLIIFNWQYSKAVQINRRRKQAEGQLKGIIGGTNDGIAAIDADYNLIVFNDAFENCFFKLFEKPVHRESNLKDILSNVAEHHFLLEHLKEALTSSNDTIIREIASTKLTHDIYEITYSSIRDSKGNLIGAALISRDVTERFAMEKTMKKTNEKLTTSMTAIKQNNQAISLLNLLSSSLQSCLSVEETFEPIKIYAKKILPDIAARLYLAHPSRNYLDLAIEWGDFTIKTGESLISPEQCWALRRGQVHRYHNSENSIACEHVKKEKTIPPYLCIPLQAQNDNVGLLYLEIPTADNQDEEGFKQLVEKHESLIITLSEAIASSLANIKLRDTLRLRSIRDPLTGLYNRSYLEESFSREVQRLKRNNGRLAVVMIDLDHFKKINDTYGHDAGDLVLTEVSRLLLEELRQSDIACRYGGEEILLLILDINDNEELYSRIETLRERISHMKILHHGKLLTNITASFGIATMPEQGDNQNQLIEAADRALYQSKKAGRNCVTIADSQLNQPLATDPQINQSSLN